MCIYMRRTQFSCKTIKSLAKKKIVWITATIELGAKNRASRKFYIGNRVTALLTTQRIFAILHIWKRARLGKSKERGRPGRPKRISKCWAVCREQVRQPMTQFLSGESIKP